MDYMNNPTERDQRIAQAGAEKLCARTDCERVPAYNIILAAIQDANQRGNEADTARLDWLTEHNAQVWQEKNGKWTVFCSSPLVQSTFDSPRSAIDAARGVQPAAKECPPWIREVGDLRRASEAIAAQQESAPAAEQGEK